MSDQNRLSKGYLNHQNKGNFYKHWKLLKAGYNKKMFWRCRETHFKVNEENQNDKLANKQNLELCYVSVPRRLFSILKNK